MVKCSNNESHHSVSSVCLEMLVGPQLVEKFLTFCRTQRYISVFKITCYLSLSSAWWMQATTSHPTSLLSNLILSFHTHLGLPSVFFLLAFSSKTLCAFFPFFVCVPCPFICSPEQYLANLWTTCSYTWLAIRWPFSLDTLIFTQLLKKLCLSRDRKLHENLREIPHFFYSEPF
jgi:hypothetical protein